MPSFFKRIKLIFVVLLKCMQFLGGSPDMDDSIRSYWEDNEKRLLAPYATHAADSKGREYPLEPCPIRTCFMRDRDRILHCKSFRRLKHKTQVFLAPAGDHYRTRLTHTLEVSQIARTISRALRLNEDLTEAIALGHDLGHTPFGHAGEAALNELVPGGFSHNSQSLRLVNKLEYEGRGMNLTWEVRDGIINHTSSGSPFTPEGRVVSLSDRIAYVNHDIDDAIRAGVLSENDIPSLCTRTFGYSHSDRIDSMIKNVITTSFGKEDIAFSDEEKDAFNVLRSFMFKNVYLNPVAKKEEAKAMDMIRALYTYYLEHVDLLPLEFTVHMGEDGVERAVADYIACMTDTYAIADFQRIFVPNAWNK